MIKEFFKKIFKIHSPSEEMMPNMVNDDEETVHAIWDPDRCADGVFCPRCNTWMDDYEGLPDKCPDCGVKLDGWIDIKDYKKGWGIENE